jgi:hypothetical protein
VFTARSHKALGFTQPLTQTSTRTPWPESASELHRPSDRSLSAKLVSTFADRRCHVVRVMNSYGRILGFLDRSRYYFFQVAPQLYSRGYFSLIEHGQHRKREKKLGKTER